MRSRFQNVNLPIKISLIRYFIYYLKRKGKLGWKIDNTEKELFNSEKKWLGDSMKP